MGHTASGLHSVLPTKSARLGSVWVSLCSPHSICAIFEVFTIVAWKILQQTQQSQTGILSHESFRFLYKQEVDLIRDPTYFIYSLSLSSKDAVSWWHRLPIATVEIITEQLTLTARRTPSTSLMVWRVYMFFKRVTACMRISSAEEITFRFRITVLPIFHLYFRRFLLPAELSDADAVIISVKVSRVFCMYVTIAQHDRRSW